MNLLPGASIREDGENDSIPSMTPLVPLRRKTGDVDLDLLVLSALGSQRIWP